MKVYFVLERLNRIGDQNRRAARGEIRVGEFTLRIVECGSKIFIRGTREAFAAYRAQFGESLPPALE